MVFRPYPRFRRTICTSVPAGTSTGVSPGFAPSAHRSPPFGSQRTYSRSVVPEGTPADGASPEGFPPFRFRSAPWLFPTTLARPLDSSVRVSRRVGRDRPPASRRRGDARSRVQVRGGRKRPSPRPPPSPVGAPGRRFLLRPPPRPGRPRTPANGRREDGRDTRKTDARRPTERPAVRRPVGDGTGGRSSPGPAVAVATHEGRPTSRRSRSVPPLTISSAFEPPLGVLFTFPSPYSCAIGIPLVFSLG